MTTATTSSVSFLDTMCARLLAAAILVAAIGVILGLNKEMIFGNQSAQSVAGMFPAYTFCRDAEFAKIEKMAAKAPDVWKPAMLMKAKQSANAMCLQERTGKSATK